MRACVSVCPCGWERGRKEAVGGGRGAQHARPSLRAAAPSPPLPFLPAPRRATRRATSTTAATPTASQKWCWTLRAVGGRTHCFLRSLLVVCCLFYAGQQHGSLAWLMRGQRGSRRQAQPWRLLGGPASRANGRLAAAITALLAPHLPSPHSLPPDRRCMCIFAMRDIDEGEELTYHYMVGGPLCGLVPVLFRFFLRVVKRWRGTLQLWTGSARAAGVPEASGRARVAAAAGSAPVCRPAWFLPRPRCLPRAEGVRLCWPCCLGEGRRGGEPSSPSTASAAAR
jgi:hypothetical protein